MESVQVVEDVDATTTVEMSWLEQPEVVAVEVAERAGEPAVITLFKVE